MTLSLMSLSCFKLATTRIQELDNHLPSEVNQEFFLASIVPLAHELDAQRDFDSATAVLVMGLSRYNGPDETRREGLAAIAAIKLNHAQAELEKFHKEGVDIQAFLQVTPAEKQAIQEIMETALALQADGLQPIDFKGL